MLSWIRRGGLLALAIAAVVGTMQFAFAEGETVAEKQRERNLRAALGRGINVSRIFNMDRKYFNSPFSATELGRIVKAAGFTNIRLPLGTGVFIVGNTRFPNGGPVSEDDTSRAIQELKAFVKDLIAENLVVTLDLHLDAGGALPKDLRCEDEKRCAAATELIRAFWARMAPEFSTMPIDSVVFELFNEPVLPRWVWQKTASELIDIIRRHNKNRFIIFGGVNWYSSGELVRLRPFVDQRIFYAFHFYHPMRFTHQGAQWMKEFRGLRNVPFPLVVIDTFAALPYRKQIWNRDMIESHFKRVSNWADRHKVPIIMNEFGAIANADEGSRLCWLNSVVRSAERYDVGWAYWDFFDPDVFGLVLDRSGSGPLNPKILSALGLADRALDAEPLC